MRHSTYPLLLAALLAGCGGVQIKPEPELPKALLSPMHTKVGLVIPAEMRNLSHRETRWGVGWDVHLGAGHVRLARDLFNAEFDEVQEFSDLESARKATGLKAIFEPRIEQYSFATARETGGRHYAVTIRYRINLYSPEGALADSYTLTGYGSALAKGMSSSGPLERASRAAMRDAAAKFLVQFPEQSAGKQLAKNEKIVAEQTASGSGAVDVIEAVPVTESASAQAPGPSPPAAPQPDPQADNPDGTPPPQLRAGD